MRPKLLKDALISLSRLEQPEQAEVQIIVVDNDASGSARSVVTEFAAETKIPVTYAVEAAKGFAAARNAALALAKGDYVAFVDDDETVDSGWLKHLLDTTNRYGADVVFGPVLPVLANDAPDWVVKGEFFDPPRFPTGTIKEYGGAGNVMISRAVLRKAGRAFNDKFNLAGGEDTEFFYYLHKIGAKMVWCDEALASETVPPQRANFQWLFRRNFRNGQMYAKIFVPQTRLFGKAKWLVRRFTSALSAAVGVAILWPFGTHRSIGAILVLARNLGQLSFLTSFERRDEQTRPPAP